MSVITVAEVIHESASGSHGAGRRDITLSRETGLRVIAGKYKSRLLASLPGMDLRPTSDRLRETLFNVLCAGDPDALEGSTWLDLYAGTGAVGIEAISRGAARVVSVESSPQAVALIQKNLRAIGIEEGFQVMRAEVGQALRKLEGAGSHADYVFLDPPYRMEEEYERTLEAMGRSPLLSPGALVVAEHCKRFEPGARFADLRRYRKLEQGDAALSFYLK
jgi:16S rRNA (guanine966-N2)-methyltransferase